ncbi:hypothetical protein ZWY2020_015824 [Hordeum vulgare]|nr:hypothetical protein ZWY2020_015824 [Hordeum vulgare]
MSYSDDENRPGECDWCHDDQDMCDRFIELDEDRRFSIKLEETFDVHTYGNQFFFLRTHHSVDFKVKLYNAESVTHFGCKNWEALYKMYGFDEGMLVTMDLGDPTIEQDNMDIWVLVDTPPIIPPFYFHSSKNVRKMVDKTHYTDGSELTYKEKNHLITFCTDLENYNVYNRTPQHYGKYVQLVHVLNYGNYHGDTLIIPNDCVPHLMYTHGRLDVLNIQPGRPTNLNCPYRISKRSGDMTIKEWKKCMDSRKELLGSKRKRSARIEDRMISILHNEESGSILFYAILS